MQQLLGLIKKEKSALTHPSTDPPDLAHILYTVCSTVDYLQSACKVIYFGKYPQANQVTTLAGTIEFSSLRHGKQACNSTKGHADL